MFTSSGGITHLEQQHLYDLAYDDWSFSSTMHAPPGFQEGCFMYEMPEKKVMKKPTKKDRHSKILTAQGARDRRMRLSLDIAKQFFYLQDQLGFDKASKTVEWLLNQSKASIKELARIKAKGSCEGKGSSSLMLDEEVQSEVEETSSHDNTNKEKPIKEKKVSVYRKRVFDPHARESRAKARLRAKQRTWLKKNKSISDSPLETAAVNDAFNSIDLHHGSSSNTVESFSSIYSFENLDSSQNQPGRPSNSSSYDNSHINLSTETAQDRLLSFPFSPSSTTPFIDLPLWSKPWEVFSN